MSPLKDTDVIGVSTATGTYKVPMADVRTFVAPGGFAQSDWNAAANTPAGILNKPGIALSTPPTTGLLSGPDKAWIDAQRGAGNFVRLGGDTMTGPLQLASAAVPSVSDDSSKVPSTGWVREVITRWPNLVLNVDPAGGVRAPVDPIGDGNGSGSAFDTIGAALDFLDRRVSAAGATLRIVSGTYAEAKDIDVHSVGRLALESSGAVTIEAPSMNFDCNVAISSGAISLKVVKAGGSGISFKKEFIIGAVAGNVVIESAGQVVFNTYAMVPVGKNLFVTNTASTPVWVNGLFSLLGTLEVSGSGSIALHVQSGNLYAPSGAISTPGTAKTIYVNGVAACEPPPATSRLNGAVFLYSHAVLAANGYIKSPNSGIITQWGTATTSATGTIQATFPIAFPNAVFSFSAIAKNPTYLGDVSVVAVSAARIDINAYIRPFANTNEPTGVTAGLEVRYIVIGY